MNVSYKVKRKIETCLDEDESIIETFYFPNHIISLTNKWNAIDWKKKYFCSKKKDYISDLYKISLKNILNDDEYITYLGGEACYYLALTNTQKIYTWQLDEKVEGMTIPKQKHILNKKGENQLIAQISVGANHSIVLTTKNEIYSWGNNKKGQCGVGTNNEPIRIPTKIEVNGLSIEESIIQICASKYYNVILTSHGNLFSWGDNSCFKCGIIGYETVLKPTKIPIQLSSEEEKITVIDTCIFFNIAFTNQKSCYSWNYQQRLDKDYFKPKKVSSPLHYVLSYGNTSLARKMITTENIDELDEEWRTPLYIACENGLEDMVKELLQKDASIHGIAYKHGSLVDIATHGGYLSILQYLLEYGVKGSKFSIFNAISRCYPEIVSVLLDYQPDLLTVRDISGDTPLCFACREGNLDIIKLLLSNGANVNHQNYKGETPLILTSHFYSNMKDKNDSQQQCLNFVSLLLEHQADMYLKNKVGLTVAMIASRSSHYALLKLFLTFNPQLVNDYSNQHCSLLHLLF